MATHPSILAWEISWTEELQSLGLQKSQTDLATEQHQQKVYRERFWKLPQVCEKGSPAYGTCRRRPGPSSPSSWALCETQGTWMGRVQVLLVSRS